MKDFAEHIVEEDGDVNSDAWAAQKLLRQREGQENRKRANKQFDEARATAATWGLTLIRHSESHYSIRWFGHEREQWVPHWIINIYPGNRRLFRDTNTIHSAPFLTLKTYWNLMDVVVAAAKATPDGWNE